MAPKFVKLKGYVLHDEMWGTFLGLKDGVCIFSSLPEGLVTAQAFFSEEAANVEKQSWGMDPGMRNFENTKPIEVEMSWFRQGKAYAKVADCVAAGLPAWEPIYPKIFEIWVSGYWIDLNKKERVEAHLIGISTGFDFDRACEQFAQENPWFAEGYYKESFKGLELFDNEAAARKVYGISPYEIIHTIEDENGITVIEQGFDGIWQKKE
ncbi:hypothetical protein B9G55_23765 [Saccharibacillus sp. O16]|nr:hypothetical protein B9G55_23765 [Saccharibacillus sp. O16]